LKENEEKLASKQGGVREKERERGNKEAKEVKGE
jgi:hypothetical protein